MATIDELYDSYKKNKGHEFFKSVHKFFPNATMESFLTFAKRAKLWKWNDQNKRVTTGYDNNRNPMIYLNVGDKQYYHIIYHREHIYLKYSWHTEKYYKKESTVLKYLAKFKKQIDEFEESNSRFVAIFGDKYNAKENTIGALYRLCYDDSNKTYCCSLGTINNLSLYKLKEIERIVNDRDFEESL